MSARHLTRIAEGAYHVTPEPNYAPRWHAHLATSDETPFSVPATVTIPAAEWRRVLDRLDTLERRVRDLRAEAA